MIVEYPNIEIEGHTFPVIRNVEEAHPDGGTLRIVLLRLSLQERNTLRSLFRKARQNATPGTVGTWQIRRIGIDTSRITVQPGQYNWWSRHDDDGIPYYKQLVRLLPMTVPVQEPGTPGITLLIDHEALSSMVTALTQRLEFLADKLLESGVINQQAHSVLTQEWVKDVISETRVDDVDWTTRRVGDAEEHLGE